MRSIRPFIAVVLAAAALAAVAAPTASAAPCWRTVINDWYRNGRVDGHYPIHCYSEAIANLPEDSKQYSTAPEDIRRDMLLAIRGDQPSGPKGPGTTSGGPGGTDNSGGSGSIPQTGFGAPALGYSASGSHGSQKDTGFINGILNTFGPKNASSVPLPLIVLAAVALLLLAAGAASFAARRFQARRIPPPRS